MSYLLLGCSCKDIKCFIKSSSMHPYPQLPVWNTELIATTTIIIRVCINADISMPHDWSPHVGYWGNQFGQGRSNVMQLNEMRVYRVIIKDANI